MEADGHELLRRVLQAMHSQVLRGLPEACGEDVWVMVMELPWWSHVIAGMGWIMLAALNVFVDILGLRIAVFMGVFLMASVQILGAIISRQVGDRGETT